MWLRIADPKTERNQENALNTTYLITKRLGPMSFEIIKPGENSETSSKKLLKHRIKIMWL